MGNNGGIDVCVERRWAAVIGAVAIQMLAMTNIAIAANENEATECVQSNLNMLGHNVGTADGILGKKSMAGAKAFLDNAPGVDLPMLSKLNVKTWCSELEYIAVNGLPPGPPTIEALQVPIRVIAGQTYMAEMSVTLDGNFDHLKGCFSWSGEGPYCFLAKYEDGIVSTPLRSGNPNTYKLEGFVTYSTEGKTITTKPASTTLVVK